MKKPSERSEFVALSLWLQFRGEMGDEAGIRGLTEELKLTEAVVVWPDVLGRAVEARIRELAVKNRWPMESKTDATRAETLRNVAAQIIRALKSSELIPLAILGRENPSLLLSIIEAELARRRSAGG